MTDIATLIEESGAIKTGKFKLSDGSLTDYYIDKYVFETRPDVLDAVADGLLAEIEAMDVDAVVGPALGAVPLVTAVSLRSGLPAAYVRQGETHRGTQARIEGTIEKGMRVAIVEDVTATGRTILDSAHVVEEAGGIVEGLVVVVDRNAEAEEAVREAGYELTYLTQVGSDFAIQ